MRVQVHIDHPQMKINEAFSGTTADDIVAAIKARVSKELGFAMRLAVNAMGNLMFAQEIVKRYNEAEKKNLPLPKSCQEFLETAQKEGIATVEA